MKILLILISLFMTSTLYANSFVLSSLDEARTISKETDKPILLIFGAESCVYCVRLKNDLNYGLKNDTHNFIICYIDLKLNPEIRTEYNITSIPESRIIVNDKEISMIKGYSQKEYRKWINNVK